MSRCRRCNTALPPGHGYCDFCAAYVDGYDSGAHHCDDFEGTTDAEIVKFVEEEIDFATTAFESAGMFAHVYVQGVTEGLKRKAERNVERNRRWAEMDAV